MESCPIPSPPRPLEPPPPLGPPAGIVDRDILRLAVPSLGALIAEPLFLLADSAFIARVSTVSLAGLGLASAILTTVIGLSVFLAYSTTASVARAFGAGRRREAIARGVDACWLALMIGAGAVLVLLLGGEWILSLFGPSAEVLAEAVTYLRLSALGVPAACSPCSRRPGCCAGCRTHGCRSWSRSPARW